MRKLKKELWPYIISVRSNDYPTMDKWCSEQLGYRFKNWYSYSDRTNWNGANLSRVYAFNDEAVYLVFKLKWGNLQ